MKSITYQQALVLVACLAAPILAYKLLSSVEAAGATAMVGMIVNFLLGRGDPPQDPPSVGRKGPGLKAIGFTGALCLLAFCLPGCALFTAQNAKTVLNVAQIACIIAHAESPDATVAQVCGVADVLIPDLEKILGEERKALAKAKKAAACHQ